MSTKSRPQEACIWEKLLVSLHIIRQMYWSQPSMRKDCLLHTNTRSESLNRTKLCVHQTKSQQRFQVFNQNTPSSIFAHVLQRTCRFLGSRLLKVLPAKQALMSGQPHSGSSVTTGTPSHLRKFWWLVSMFSISPCRDLTLSRYFEREARDSASNYDATPGNLEDD